MFDFENKPIKNWTLAECKQYCENRRSKINSEYSYCGDYCALSKCRMCGFIPEEMNLKTIPQFTPDEIAFCRLIKKTEPWANYIGRSKNGGLAIFEKIQNFERDIFYDNKNSIWKFLNDNFFPQIVPMTYYAIDNIIKQGENDERK